MRREYLRREAWELEVCCLLAGAIVDEVKARPPVRCLDPFRAATDVRISTSSHSTR
jgi:hypothetical protein